MRNKRHQRAIRIFDRYADDQTRANFRGHSEVDKPDLTALWLAHSLDSCPSYSRKAAFAEVTSSSSEISGYSILLEIRSRFASTSRFSVSGRLSKSSTMCLPVAVMTELSGSRVRRANSG